MCILKHPDAVPAGAGTYQDLFALFTASSFVAPDLGWASEHLSVLVLFFSREFSALP
jgi:hypothetical protein